MITTAAAAHGHHRGQEVERDRQDVILMIQPKWRRSKRASLHDGDSDLNAPSIGDLFNERRRKRKVVAQGGAGPQSGSCSGVLQGCRPSGGKRVSPKGVMELQHSTAGLGRPPEGCAVVVETS